MNEKEEIAYELGSYNAWMQIYIEATNKLGIKKEVKLESERIQTISLLRSLCMEYGDNDWDESLHLVDIIEKHLINYIINEKFYEKNT
jgi:predicted secreted protein